MNGITNEDVAKIAALAVLIALGLLWLTQYSGPLP